MNHTMADGAGAILFLNAVAECARGAPEPSAQPVWERHLLCARDPPRITHAHREYDQLAGTKGTTTIPLDQFIHKSFFFGAREMSNLRRLLPEHLKSSSTFEVLSACVWRCRTIALEANPDDEVRFIGIADARSKYNPPLPNGYYGNVLAFPAAISTAGELCRNPVGYAVELLKKAKHDVREGYMRSVSDLMHVKGRPCLITEGRSFVVSNWIRIKLDEVDFGWGMPAYSGATGELPGIVSFYIPYKNKKGERGIVFPICLPALAMERFAKEIHWMLRKSPEQPKSGSGSSVFINSSL